MLFLSERKKLLCEDTCGEVLVVLLITINATLLSTIHRDGNYLQEMLEHGSPEKTWQKNLEGNILVSYPIHSSLMSTREMSSPTEGGSRDETISVLPWYTDVPDLRPILARIVSGRKYTFLVKNFSLFATVLLRFTFPHNLTLERSETG